MISSVVHLQTGFSTKTKSTPLMTCVKLSIWSCIFAINLSGISFLHPVSYPIYSKDVRTLIYTILPRTQLSPCCAETSQNPPANEPDLAWTLTCLLGRGDSGLELHGLVLCAGWLIRRVIPGSKVICGRCASLLLIRSSALTGAE